jgi:hypothetical protein
LPDEAAHRGASNTFLSVSVLTSRPSNDRGLHRSRIAGNTPSTAGAFFSWFTSLADKVAETVIDRPPSIVKIEFKRSPLLDSPPLPEDSPLA